MRLKIVVQKMMSVISRLQPTAERGILTNFGYHLLTQIKLLEGQRTRIITSLKWMTTQLKWKHDDQKGALDAGSRGGDYSELLQAAIDLLKELEKEDKPEVFLVSTLKHHGLWADSTFNRSEMGLEKLLRACEDHEQIEIVVDIEIPKTGATGLEEWCLKQGASKVTFTGGNCVPHRKDIHTSLEGLEGNKDE